MRHITRLDRDTHNIELYGVCVCVLCVYMCTFACDRSTSAGRSHLFPTNSFIASGHPLRGGGGRDKEIAGFIQYSPSCEN